MKLIKRLINNNRVVFTIHKCNNRKFEKFIELKTVSLCQGMYRGIDLIIWKYVFFIILRIK